MSKSAEATRVVPTWLNPVTAVVALVIEQDHVLSVPTYPVGRVTFPSDPIATVLPISFSHQEFEVAVISKVDSI